MKTLHPATCRAARALLDWTQDDLARAAGICRSTVREFEQGHHSLQSAKEEAIIGALSRAGVQLLGSPLRGVGVRLARQDKD